MSTKTASSLSAFVKKTTAVPFAPETPAAERMGDDVKKLSLRLTRAQWIRVSHLALERDTSVQQMALDGLSRLFTDTGLPPL